MTSPVNPESEQRIYDSDFLKLLANPPSPAARQFTPGCRTVAVNLRREIGRYDVTLDLSDQVLTLTVPDDFRDAFRVADYIRGEKNIETPLCPSFAELDLDASTFAPAAALVLKAKQFDDGLYASVELATDAGLGLSGEEGVARQAASGSRCGQ